MRFSRPRSEAGLNERGSVALEFALFALGGFLLLLASSDLIYYMRTRLRLDQVASGIAGYVTTFSQLYEGDFAAFFQAAQQMAGNVHVTDAKGETIITGIAYSSGTPTVMWRRDTKNPKFQSALGEVGKPSTNLPDNYALPVGSALVAVEVFTSVEPWVLHGGVADEMRSIVLFQPRGPLLTQVLKGVRP